MFDIRCLSDRRQDSQLTGRLFQITILANYSCLHLWTVKIYANLLAGICPQFSLFRGLRGCRDLVGLGWNWRIFLETNNRSVRNISLAAVRDAKILPNNLVLFLSYCISTSLCSPSLPPVYSNLSLWFAFTSPVSFTLSKISIRWGACPMAIPIPRVLSCSPPSR